MSAGFLVKFMHFAKQAMDADRCMAVDGAMHLLETVNLTEAIMQTPQFVKVSTSALTQAIEAGETVVTNNIITDISQAPVTNTNFSDLRFVVVIPIGHLGAVYLDRTIRRGIIPRETVEKVSAFAVYLVENDLLDTDETELEAIFAKR